MKQEPGTVSNMSAYKQDPDTMPVSNTTTYTAATSPAGTTTNNSSSSPTDRVEWSRSTILGFIEDYRRQRVLWDPNTKGYHIKQTKYESLKTLAHKYGTEIRSIRSKIKSLRSSFHREHGKVINGRRKGMHYQPMWFAYEAIRFILDGESDGSGAGSVKNESNIDIGQSMSLCMANSCADLNETTSALSTNSATVKTKAESPSTSQGDDEQVRPPQLTPPNDEESSHGGRDDLYDNCTTTKRETADSTGGGHNDGISPRGSANGSIGVVNFGIVAAGAAAAGIQLENFFDATKMAYLLSKTAHIKHNNNNNTMINLSANKQQYKQQQPSPLVINPKFAKPQRTISSSSAASTTTSTASAHDLDETNTQMARVAAAACAAAAAMAAAANAKNNNNNSNCNSNAQKHNNSNNNGGGNININNNNNNNKNCSAVPAGLADGNSSSSTSAVAGNNPAHAHSTAAVASSSSSTAAASVSNSDLDGDLHSYCNIRAEDVKTEIIEPDMLELNMLESKSQQRTDLTPSPFSYFNNNNNNILNNNNNNIRPTDLSRKRKAMPFHLSNSLERYQLRAHHEDTDDNDERPSPSKQQLHNNKYNHHQYHHHHHLLHHSQPLLQLQHSNYHLKPQISIAAAAGRELSNATNATTLIPTINHNSVGLRAGSGTGSGSGNSTTNSNGNGNSTSNNNSSKQPNLNQTLATPQQALLPSSLTQSDEYGIFGEYVAITIRKLKTSKAKIVVKHLINNLLYEAELGKYDHGMPSSKEPPQLYKM